MMMLIAWKLMFLIHACMHIDIYPRRDGLLFLQESIPSRNVMRMAGCVYRAPTLHSSMQKKLRIAGELITLGGDELRGVLLSSLCSSKSYTEPRAILKPRRRFGLTTRSVETSNLTSLKPSQTKMTKSFVCSKGSLARLYHLCKTSFH